MTEKQLPVKMVMTAEDKGVSTALKKTEKSLEALGVAAKKSGSETADGLAKIGAEGEKTSVKIDRSTRSIANSIQRQLAAIRGGGAQTASAFEALTNIRGADANFLRPLIQQLKEAEAAQAKFNRTAAAGGGALNNTTLSAKQLQNAIRGVPAQFTDIVTGLANGQSALTVFTQQGGQLKDMFGGVGAAASALGRYVLGLINPFTVAAAAAAALGYAYFQGSKEAQEFNKALILSGNASGTTSSQLTEMAKRIDKVTGTQAAASEALVKFASTGDVAAENIERFTLAAVRFERVGGEAVDETVKKFTELRRAPLEASIKLNESLNYLTQTTYGQIKALQEQGKEAEAAAAAQNAFAAAMENRTASLEANLGIIERGWLKVKGAAKDAWDSILDIGREDTLDEKLKKAQSLLNQRRRTGSPIVQESAAFEEGNRQLQDSINLMSRQLLLQENVALTAAQAAEKVKARIQYDEQTKRIIENEDKLTKEINIARGLGITLGLKQSEIEARILAIRKKFGKEADTKQQELNKAQLLLDVETIRNANEQLVGSYANAERILEAQRAAGLLGDREYYEAKKAFLRLNSDANEAALKEEIARLERETLAGKAKVENDKRIGEAQSKLAVLRAKAGAELDVISTQEQTAANKLKVAYLTAQQAAEDYLFVLQRQQQRQIAGMGLGEQARRQQEGLQQILDKYDAQRRDIENRRAQATTGGTLTDTVRDQLDKELELINTFQTKAVDSYNGYYAELIAAQGNWVIGAQQAFSDYLESARDVAAQTKSLFTSAFNGLNDALADFVTTGKGNFKSLATSIIADLARMQAKAATSQLFSFLANSLFGGSGSDAAISAAFSDPSRALDIAPRAQGGPVRAGGHYRVNENGPELLDVGGKTYLMMGNQGGHVTPNGAVSGGNTVNYNIAAGVQRSELQSSLQKLEQGMRASFEQRLRAAGV